MGKMIVGYIEVTKLVEAMKAGHSAFKRGKDDNKDRIFCNVTIWENDGKNDQGYNYGIQLNSSKEKRGEEKKVYIGNAKTLDPKGDVPKEDMSAEETSAAGNAAASALDDLPF